MNPPVPNERGNALLATPVPPRAPAQSLPLWIVPLLLLGLAATCGLIALFGWLVLRPAPANVAAVKPIVQLEAPPIAAKPLPVLAKPAQPDEEPIDLKPHPPAETPQVLRRLPAGAAEPEMPVIAPLPANEPPSTEVFDLIMPIEVAKKEDAAIPHSVRRLQLAEGAPVQQLKLAVTPVVHDDLGSVLTRMGEGYRFTKLRSDDVLSYESLKKYDVVFLTCADLYAKDFQAALPLRKFVAGGGTLYASDLRGDLLQAAFPEFRARGPVLPGVPQKIEASVTEPGLQSYLGRKAIPLSFEAPDWRPAPFDPSKVTVCLKGTYRNNLGQALSVPLLVTFQFQKGTVIFTSFHHAKNDSETVQKLLEYLVFASVNARNEARVKDLMQRTGFTPQELRPALVSAGDGIHATYAHPGGGLQIAVGFENLGAKLKLTLRSPNGRTIEHIDRDLFLIEIPNAEPGTWHYTIAPLELPYANFPMMVSVGPTKS